MSCRIFLIIALFASVHANAQFRLPSFDISVKGGYINLTDDYSVNNQSEHFVYESIGIQGEIHAQFGQHLALGWFYGKSGYANYHEQNSNSTEAVDKVAEHLQYGLNARLSAGRSSRLRPYVQAKYFWLQVAVQQSGYRAGNEFTGFAGGAGLMLRASHRLYINLIEAEINMLTKQKGIMFNSTDKVPQVRAGLTYNFSKRK